MKNMESRLQNSGGIRFILKLYNKNTDSLHETYAVDNSSDADKYINVKLNSPNSGVVSKSNGVWTWTIPTSTYLENGILKTSSNNVFKGDYFSQSIQLQVNIKNVESLSHFYSNYKVELTAEILSADSSENTDPTVISGTKSSDYIIYTLAKIKPEFM